MAASTFTPAILLRSIPFGESDLIVTLLGRATGKLSAVAKGARKSQRRFGGGLGLGASGEAALREKAGAELLLLDSFEAEAPRIGLGSDIGRTAHAAYAVELCERLCPPRHPEPELFDWLDEFLVRLESSVASAPRLRAFELGLLGRLGLAPILDVCARCGRRDLDETAARWLPSHGGVHCRTCAREGSLLSSASRQALSRLARSSLAEAELLPLTKEVNAGCREALLELFGQHFQGPLKSVEFINKLGG